MGLRNGTRTFPVAHGHHRHLVDSEREQDRRECGLDLRNVAECQCINQIVQHEDVLLRRSLIYAQGPRPPSVGSPFTRHRLSSAPTRTRIPRITAIARHRDHATHGFSQQRTDMGSPSRGRTRSKPEPKDGFHPERMMLRIRGCAWLDRRGFELLPSRPRRRSWAPAADGKGRCFASA